MPTNKVYEIRDPVHGFIQIDELERDIINHPAFQRLRRIKQLALTDLVYPGAVHTRFEHSLGVMHFAEQMFNSILNNTPRSFFEDLGYTQDGLKRALKVIRLAALLHDVGHPPFSHAAEDLLPEGYNHEDYTIKIIEHVFKDLIETHEINLKNYNIKIDEIITLLGSEKASVEPPILTWKPLITSQLDADRGDYLLRDSHHIGVEYGKYDKSRLLTTLQLAEDGETGSPKLAINEGGIQIAESIIIARYLMFTQVYFQHTRRVYDLHLQEAMKKVLENIFGKPKFPPPDEDGIKHYLNLDDFAIFTAFKNKQGGDHGNIILNRNHYRRLTTLESKLLLYPPDLQHDLVEKAKASLEDEGIPYFVDNSTRSWYLTDKEITIYTNDGQTRNLSELSPIVANIKHTNITRIYVPEEHRGRADEIMLNAVFGGE